MANRKARVDRKSVRSNEDFSPSSRGAGDDLQRYSRNAYGSGVAGSNQAKAGSFKSAYTPDSSYRHVNNGAVSQYSRNGGQYKAKKRGRAAKIAIGILIAVLVVAIGAGVAFAMYVGSINKELQGNKTEEELQAIDAQLTRTTTFTEPFYVMLIGSDARADDEEMGQRSDTNIVVRVDPTTNTVTMVSIPRDTMTNVDGVGVTKFNAAYNYGGAASTIREAKDLTGIEISHYAEIDFDGLIGLVDAVGGVDVMVDERIDDEDAGDIVIEAGEQHLNGEAALVFARSRAYVDGDFTRISNQRKLVQAVIDKVLAMPVGQLPGVISAAAKCVTTDLTVNDIVNLAMQMQETGDLTIYSATIPSTTKTIDGISYVVADTSGTKELMNVVDQGGDPTTVENGYLASVDTSSVPGSGGSTSVPSGGSSNGGYTGGYTNTGGYAGGTGGYSNGYSNTGGYSN